MTMDNVYRQNYTGWMRKIGAGDFKQTCLRLLDEVQESGTAIVITKHGRPVARVIPFERDSADLIGSLEGKVEVLGNVFDTGATWDADAER